jgi:hypothetical protein
LATEIARETGKSVSAEVAEAEVTVIKHSPELSPERAGVAASEPSELS